MIDRINVFNVLNFFAGVPAIIPFIGPAGSLSNENNRLNFTVILVDDLGYNDPCCFNTITSGIVNPNIYRLTANGILFKDWQSAHSISGPQGFNPSKTISCTMRLFGK